MLDSGRKAQFALWAGNNAHRHTNRGTGGSTHTTGARDSRGRQARRGRGTCVQHASSAGLSGPIWQGGRTNSVPAHALWRGGGRPHCWSLVKLAILGNPQPAFSSPSPRAEERVECATWVWWWVTGEACGSVWREFEWQQKWVLCTPSGGAVRSESVSGGFVGWGLGVSSGGQNDV